MTTTSSRVKVLGLAIVATLVAAVANALDAPQVTVLAVLAAALAAGEVLVLHVGEDIPPLPLSYALLPVLAVRFEAAQYSAAVLAGVAAGMLLASGVRWEARIAACL